MTRNSPATILSKLLGVYQKIKKLEGSKCEFFFKLRKENGKENEVEKEKEKEKSQALDKSVMMRKKKRFKDFVNFLLLEILNSSSSSI